MRTAPTESKEKQGSIERYHQTLHDHIITLRLSLSAIYKIEAVGIQASHPIMTWHTRHDTWLLNRYIVHDDGLTIYLRGFNSASTPSLVKLADKVSYKLHIKHNITKGGPSFITGL